MRFLLFIQFCLLSLLTNATEEPSWMRYPAISPDGKTIAFSFKGDLYIVSINGGIATPLTQHMAHDYMPVWSKDGSMIAFASNRHGNFDIFTISVSGGSVNRLTYHSANDYPSSFSLDNKEVLFSSSRMDDATNQAFPSSRLPELYAAKIAGGMPRQVLTTPAQAVTLHPNGEFLSYHDQKGYEDPFRKHHTSSVTRDIWTYNSTTGAHHQITTFSGEDREPLYSSDASILYFLSERNGSFNIHSVPVKDGKSNGDVEVITRFKKHPVRNLSISSDNILCFSFDGQIYTMKEEGKPQKVSIKVRSDETMNNEQFIKVSSASEMHISPDGKEMAFIYRGEVFSTSVETGTTKRITNSPEMERSVSFSPDGKAILYASERNGSWNIYQTTLGYEDEKYFFNATVLNEEALVETNEETFQPAYSPNGKEVAFLHERTSLRVLNLDSKKIRTVVDGALNYSYSDGDQYYQWSPDSKWFLVQYLPNKQWIGDVGLVSASGEEQPINLTQSGFGDSRPKWMMGGETMLWFSGRDGKKNQGGWGRQSDAYAMFFTKDSWMKFNLSKEELELMVEDSTETKKDSSDLVFDLDGLKDRKKRLTIHSSSLSDAVINPKGDKLYYMSAFEKGYDLWETDLKTRETKILLKMNARGGRMQMDNKGKYLYVLNGGKVVRITLASKKKNTIQIQSEMILNASEERTFLFEHMWRQVKKKFYKKDLHDVDWDFYKKAYAKYLSSIHTGFDFSEMMSELLGELNASHTGCRYRPSSSILGDKTASLGLFFDQSYKSQDGMMIKEVIKGGPVDLADDQVKANILLTHINDQKVGQSINIYAILNRMANQHVRLTFLDPSSKKTWQIRVKPISLGSTSNLLYKRWVNNCREITERVSNGRIGYVHVRGMNSESFKVVYEEALGRNATKEALIVDTRFNGGGWLHDDLATFLGGKVYLRIRPRNQNIGVEPMFKWHKPSAVLMGEGNYSDAHMFPYAYKALGVGALVGMPVPGTATAVWWERLPGGYVFGIPQVGMVTNDGSYLENTQLEPDIQVRNDYQSVAKGQDKQIERAVEYLLETLDAD